MRVNLAVPDWQDRIRVGRSLMPALNVNPPLRERIERAFGQLRLPDVPGKPTMSVACGDWFKEFVGGFLSAIDPETGARVVSEAFVLAPKKSSKTTYGAGMMLTAVVLNKRPNAEFLFTGPTIDISDRAYGAAVGMIDADDEWQKQENGQEGYLKKIFHTRDHLKTIEHRTTGASLSIKTFDMKVATGVNPVGVLVDELHVIAKDRNAMRVLGQLRGGKISNPEAFFCVITTQSDEPPVGAMEAALKLARATRDGTVHSDTLSVLYEFPPEIVKPVAPGVDPIWYDTRLWPMVTPNLGRNVTIEALEREFIDARQKGAAEIQRWASQHLNIEMGVALGSSRWAGADYWEACADPAITLDAIKTRCDLVVVGIDGGGLDDLLGLVVLGRDRDTRDWLMWAHAWAHKSVFERRKDIASTLQDFANAGELTIVENVGDDTVAIADIVEELDTAGLLPQTTKPGETKVAIGVDQAGIIEVVDELGQRGIGDNRIGGVPQGWKLTNAIKTAERKLAGGALKHGGQKLMAWQVGNAKVEARGNAIIITKQAAGSAKIDCLMALFDAIVAMGQNPDTGPSVYEERGLLVF